jgi:hypothetical protein
MIYETFSIDLADSYHFVCVAEETINSAFGDDNSSALDANTATCPETDEDWILALGVVHEFDDFVQQNADRWNAHAVTY